MSKQVIEIKGAMCYGDVVGLLEDLIRCFKEKSICIRGAEQCVALAPGGVVELEIEASAKKEKQKLSIELEWSAPLALEPVAGLEAEA
jgi:amphi-Trp domain-containing protein